MKVIPVSYKQLYVIVEAVEFKLAHDEKRDTTTLSEDEIAYLDDDIAFMKAILVDLRKNLEQWDLLPSTR